MLLPGDIEKAALSLRSARIKSKEQFLKRYKRKIQHAKFEKDSLVLIRNTAIDMTLTKLKTEPKYLGPYRVEMRTTMGNYILAELNGAMLARPVAAFRVIPYFARDSSEMREILNERDEELYPEEYNSGDQGDMPDEEYSENETEY
jgi:hypothetical protein